MRVYGAIDAPAHGLGGEVVAVLGYGNLGRSAALNLRDSGAKIVVGNRDDDYAIQARRDGFEVRPIAAAAAEALVFLLLPDEVIPEVFEHEVAPVLRPGAAVAFASGYCLAFGLVHPPETVDVLLLAPRIAGGLARVRYEAGEGFWAFVGVEADRSGHAHGRLLGLAAGLGVLRTGAVEMTAAREAILDLFVEQTVGAVLGMSLMIAFEVGTEAGIPPEAIVMEMYMSGEMEAVLRSFRETGFLRACEEHGPTALFGGILRTLELDRDALVANFRNVLADITSGGFARRFQSEAQNGYPLLHTAREMVRGRSPMSDAEDRLRGLLRAASPLVAREDRQRA
jgi:ketol-acid reductoisomerase